MPSPSNTVCVECLRPLAQTGAERPIGPSAPLRTTREAAAVVVIRFEAGTVEVTLGRPVLLGRDPAGPGAQLLADHDNVSRRHATVGLEPDGSAWVRDEGSTNGTFIDDVRISPGSKAALSNGAELRLASNVRATVQVRTDRG